VTRPKRPSLRASIDAFCKRCIYDPGNGNGAWREQVQGCSSTSCPLHAVRPMSKKAVSSPENDALPLDPTDEPEDSILALLGEEYGQEGPVSER
jgi:hypothetical protein